MEVRGGSNNYYAKERVNMDYESALEYIHHCIDVGNIIFEIPKDEEIINTIKVALEKQIPKKAVMENQGVFHLIHCPSCERILLGNNFKEHCSYCGQKIDTED